MEEILRKFPWDNIFFSESNNEEKLVVDVAVKLVFDLAVKPVIGLAVKQGTEIQT